MSQKMWAGRFTKEIDERVNDFNSSIKFDARMYKQDIVGSIAHATMKVFEKNMRVDAAKGFINATDRADYLVKKGMPFRDAYKITGALVHTCIEKGCTLETLDLEEYRKLSDIFDTYVYDHISLDACVMQRRSEGGPAPCCVKNQIAYIEKNIENIC